MSNIKTIDENLLEQLWNKCLNTFMMRPNANAATLEFLQNEYDKTLNFFNENQKFLNLDNGGNRNNTRGWTGASSFLKAGTYTISLGTDITGTYKWAINATTMLVYDIDGSPDGMVYDSDWITSNNSLTFTISQDLYIGIYVATQNGSGNVDINYLNSLKIMLNPGSTISSYQKYYGPIVHQSDVEPVLLWENGNPTSSFAGGTSITISNMSNFKYLIFGCKINQDGDSAIQYFKVKFSSTNNTKIYLSMTSNDTNDLYHRRLRITSSTTIVADNGYINSTSNNASFIPIEIYGSNI